MAAKKKMCESDPTKECTCGDSEWIDITDNNLTPLIRIRITMDVEENYIKDTLENINDCNPIIKIEQKRKG